MLEFLALPLLYIVLRATWGDLIIGTPDSPLSLPPYFLTFSSSSSTRAKPGEFQWASMNSWEEN